MRKYLIYLALALSVVSCTVDPVEPEPEVEPGETTSNLQSFTRMEVDQSRVSHIDAAQAYYKAAYNQYFATRAGFVEDPKHPYEKCPSLEDVKKIAKEYNGSTMWSSTTSEKWIVSESNGNAWINAGGRNGTNNAKHIELYIAKSNVTISLDEYNNGVGSEDYYSTIYIMEGVTGVKFNGNTICSSYIVKNWGEVDFSGGLTMYYNSKFYNYNTEKELIIGKFSNHNPNGGEFVFESYGPVHFAGERVEHNQYYIEHGTTIGSGDYWFGSTVRFDDLYINQSGRHINIDFSDCSYIGYLSFDASNFASNINVAYYLELEHGFTTQNGAPFNFNLSNGVLVINGDADQNNSGNNVFVQRTQCVNGEGDSAVYIQGSISVWKDIVSNMEVPNFKTGSSAHDYLAVFGKRHVKNENGNIIKETDPPIIFVQDQSQNWHDDKYNTKFVDNGILISDADFNNYKIEEKKEFTIISNDPQGLDCRGPFTQNWETEPDPETPGEVVNPPYHKYSATSLDFSPDGKYVYVSWHSNLPGGENQPDGEGGNFDHDHGTNMDPDNENPDYGGPSVENKKDWGGFVDILEINSYDPDDANWGDVEGHPNIRIMQTLYNQEHKYNHIKLYNNTLYLTTTSWYVGAALHVAPLKENELDVDDEEAYRINLTGVSANCVEIVNDSDIVTVSGRSVGGLNWFSLDDESNQSKKYKAGGANYGGKYVCIGDDGNVYVLHDTDNATVTCYGTDGTQLGEMKTGVALVPYDGKNTLMVRDGKVYVCCGRNGLRVFNWADKSEVGRTRVSANCVDIDEEGKYFYVATGAGVAKFKAKETYTENNVKYFTKVANVAYKGQGFNYPNGSGGPDTPMESGTVKESSNFVRVKGNKVFVAYGMYGLRIYNAADLTSPGSSAAPEN